MAQPQLAPGKKRYSVSLSQANVERFQALCKDFGMPSNTMSNALDETITGLCEMFNEAKERGTMNLEDIFRLMGRKAQLLIDEERKEVKKNEPEQKRDSVSGSKTKTTAKK